MKKPKYSWSEYGYCIIHKEVHKIEKGCKKLVVTNKQILEEIAKCPVIYEESVEDCGGEFQ